MDQDAIHIPSNSILQRLVDKIEAASVDSRPSENIYMEDLFDPAVYSDIVSHMPSDEDYAFINHPEAVLPDGRITRKILGLTPKTIERFDPQIRPLWRKMEKVCTSPVLVDALTHKFRDRLQERFGGVMPEMNMVPVFYRDFPGYRIGIHPDTVVKIMTFQFYLPKDNSQIHLGTTFHVPDSENKLNEYKTNPFKPNSGYAFVRTDCSWHSVKQLHPHEKARDTLALTLYIKGKEFEGYE